MKNWIKENLVLAIGLTLPLLLILLFFLASVLPKLFGQPPQYEMLFTTQKYDYQHKSDYVIDLYVKNQHIFIKAHKNPDKNNFNSTQLMAYDGKTETVHEIKIDESKLSVDVEALLDETKNMTIDTSLNSPDGYALEGPNYGSSGLLGGLFGGGYNNGGFRLKKGGVAYKISSVQQNYYYNQLQFVGWVIKK